MGKYKTKATQADLGIFVHITAYLDRSRHIQSDIIRHIQVYSEPCVTLTYSEQWLIQNPGLFITLAYSEPEAYSGP